MSILRCFNLVIFFLEKSLISVMEFVHEKLLEENILICILSKDFWLELAELEDIDHPLKVIKWFFLMKMIVCMIWKIYFRDKRDSE